jgi:energy-coupling factor transport system ATP-binding protein
VAELTDAGRTVIAISHDMRFVAETFERVVVMREGRVALDGPPGVVFAAAHEAELASTFLEAPLAARLGERLGLGATPSEAALLAALAARGPAGP